MTAKSQKSLSRWQRAFASLSFHNQLALLFIFGFATVTLVTSAGAVLLASKLVTENFQREGRVLTQLFVRQSQLALLYGSEDSAKQSVRSLHTFPDVVQAAMYEADGHLLYQSGPGVAWHEQPLVTYGVVLEYEDDRYWQFGARVQLEANDSEAPFDVGQIDAEDLGHVRVLVSKNSLHDMVQRIVTGTWLIAAAVLLVILAYQRRVSLRITRPLRYMVETMKRVEQRQSGTRITITGAVEWQQIGSAFNKMMDVIEGHETELMQKRDEALAISRRKSEFAANISHELRTPMNGILGMLDLLADQNLGDKEREHLDVARSSGDQLLLLINDILDFSKLDAGRVELERIPFNLAELLEELQVLHGGSENGRKLNFGSLISEDVPLWLVGDPTRVRQLLNNLIGNAVKFTSLGDVWVEVEVMAQNEAELWLRIDICDTGIGIAAADQQRIFDAYSQQDGSTNRKYGGTGLGLSICRQLTEVMGGSLSVQSELGVGSRFSAELAFATDHNGPLPDTLTEVEQRTHTANTSILMLTEPGLIARSVANMARREGLQLDPLYEGNLLSQKLIQAELQGAPYDLVVADYRPGQDGLKQLVECARQQPKRSWKSVALVPIGTDSVDLGDGIDHCLTKPLRSIALRRLLNQAPAIQHGQATTDPKPSMNEPLFKGKRVLLVEDNEVNQKVAKGILRKLGVQADVAANGEQAIRAWRQQAYDLILMDCQMPLVDGFQATAEIRQQEVDDHRIPIVALTANVTKDDIHRCRESGMDDYVAKPVRRSKLEATLSRWLLPTEPTS